MTTYIALDRDEDGKLRDPVTGEAIILVIEVDGEPQEIPAIYFPGEAKFKEAKSEQSDTG